MFPARSILRAVAGSAPVAPRRWTFARRRFPPGRKCVPSTGWLATCTRKRQGNDGGVFPFGEGVEIDDKPPGSFRKKSARGCMFMGNKQIKEIRFGKLGGSQSLFLSSRGARPFF